MFFMNKLILYMALCVAIVLIIAIAFVLVKNSTVP